MLSASGRARPLAEPRVEIVTVRGNAVHRPQRRVDRGLGRGRVDHAGGDRDDQFVDVLDGGVATGADDQVEIVVVGVPDIAVAPELADVDVPVLVAFVARGEVEDRGPQAQVRQQPRFEIMELRVVGRSRHVQPPLLDAVLVDRAHEAFGSMLVFAATSNVSVFTGCGVAGTGCTLAGEPCRTQDHDVCRWERLLWIPWRSQVNIPSSHTPSSGRWVRSSAPRPASRSSASTNRPAISPPPSTSSSVG